MADYEIVGLTHRLREADVSLVPYNDACHSYDEEPLVDEPVDDLNQVLQYGNKPRLRVTSFDDLSGSSRAQVTLDFRWRQFHQPAANGGLNQWPTVFPGGAHWDAVNDAINLGGVGFDVGDGDATYLQATDGTVQVETFTLDPQFLFKLRGRIELDIWVTANRISGTGGGIQPLFRINGTSYPAPTAFLPSGYADYNYIGAYVANPTFPWPPDNTLWNQHNPATGVEWTLDDLKTLEFGFQTIGSGSSVLRVTRVYLQMDVVNDVPVGYSYAHWFISPMQSAATPVPAAPGPTEQPKHVLAGLTSKDFYLPSVGYYFVWARVFDTMGNPGKLLGPALLHKVVP